ncbi:MAG: COX15/CtaA family protein [Tepidimonas sp.]|uniref:COX15/CtaA family protein n=1 Tax=Tepidimonas sp. TaxID=2002775 RepID=UPI00298F2A28|nr:COX15/CtaA family protein [Tepidimonas sp.]MDW8337073.1 COX15/CtaA family protein [Tepidimonas sp.]
METLETFVDLGPLGRLLLLGALLAAGPLLWVWLKHRGAAPQQRLRALTTLTLFLTFDLVLFGAFTRLTDSGLGCPDWPGCYGAASPLGARHEIAAAQAALPTGPVTWSKAWIEMIHRYLATAVGALILVIAGVSTVLRRRGLDTPVRWAWLTLAWVCLQGAFGALTVTMKLFPAIVTLHLLGGMVLLALLRWQSVRYAAGGASSDAGPPALRWALWGLLALVGVQIALGGWVSTNYAVLACRDFPTCQGQWWPPMDFARGFELWRELGEQGSGEALPFAALTAIHYTHRLAAYGVLAALLAVGVWQARLGQRGRARWLWGLALWQLLSGLSNVVLEWPLVAALAHTGGAAALVVVLTGWLARPEAPWPAAAAAARAAVLQGGHA